MLTFVMNNHVYVDIDGQVDCPVDGQVVACQVDGQEVNCGDFHW